MDIVKFKEFIKSDPDLQSYLEALQTYLDKTDFNNKQNREFLINDHRLSHILYNKIKDGEKIINQQGPLKDLPISEKQIEEEHRLFVETMKRVGIHHTISGGVDNSLPKDLKEFTVSLASMGLGNKLNDILIKLKDRDKYNKKVDDCNKTLTTSTGEALIPTEVVGPIKPQWVKYVVNPQSEYIYQGKKTLLLSSIKFKKHIDEPLYIADKRFIYGIYKIKEAFIINNLEIFNKHKLEHMISEAEARVWWGKEDIIDFPLYAYHIEVVKKFRVPVAWEYVSGFQGFMRSDRLFHRKDIEHTAGGLIIDDIGVEKSINLNHLTLETISQISDKELEKLHTNIHILWNDNNRKKKNSPSDEIIYNIHTWIKSILLKRHMKHVETDKLDKEKIDKSIAKSLMVICKNCNKSIDYLQQAEVGMGYIKCPNCGYFIDQEGNATINFSDGIFKNNDFIQLNLNNDASCYSIVDNNIEEDVINKALNETNEGDSSTKYWEENWYKNYPKLGRGKFILQQHFMGLTEEQSKLSQPELLNNKDVSVHGDIRISVDKDSLIGWTIFYGTTANVKKDGGDRLINIGKRRLQCIPKSLHSDIWLNVGKDKPYTIEPGGVGSTSKTFSKIFMMDSGTYALGVVRDHAIELFFNSDKLKGRYIITFVPIGESGKRVWLISRPNDTTPFADNHSLKETAKEIKSNGQRYLIWSNGKSVPILYDLDKTDIETLKK